MRMCQRSFITDWNIKMEVDSFHSCQSEIHFDNFKRKPEQNQNEKCKSETILIVSRSS